MNDAFIAPPVELLGLKLRPYSYGSELQLEQIRLVLRKKLTGILEAESDEDARNLLSASYYIAAFLFVHSADPKLVEATCWNTEKLLAEIRLFMSRFKPGELWRVQENVADIISKAREAQNYTVESEMPPDPNSSSPVEQLATSGQSQS